LTTSAPTPAVTAAWVRDFVALGAIWGSSFLFIRLAVGDFGPLATTALRVSIGAAFLLPVLLWRSDMRLLRQHWRALLVVGVLSSALPFGLYAYALTFITTGLSAILNATTPMFAALVAWIWLRDGLGVWRSLGLALGFAGVIVLAWDQASFKATGGMGPLLAVLACLGACMSYAVAASYTRLHLSQVPPLVTATGSQIGASVALALPAAFTWPTQAPSATAWLAVLVVGVFCTGLAYLLFYRLIARGSPSRTMTVGYLIPLFAVVYGVLLLDEQLTPAMVTGGLVILLGTALASGLLQPQKRIPKS
jgi:drug/metabolite transporter (DMT)-like permease